MQYGIKSRPHLVFLHFGAEYWNYMSTDMTTTQYQMYRGVYVTFEMSVNERVMMSSEQRSSLCHPDNLLNDEH